MNQRPAEASLCGREFEYNLSRATIVVSLLLFGISATVFGYECVTNQRGLILNGIPFTPFGATVFYGSVAGVSVLCLGMGVWLAFRRGRIVFAKECLLIPKSWWSSAAKSVPYRDLQGIRLGVRGSAVTGARLLYVQHKRGIECLSAAMFSSEPAFDEFLQLLIRTLAEHEVPEAVE